MSAEVSEQKIFLFLPVFITVEPRVSKIEPLVLINPARTVYRAYDLKPHSSSDVFHSKLNISTAEMSPSFCTESVIPSSGTFHVKLPKKPGVELGITISCK